MSRLRGGVTLVAAALFASAGAAADEAREIMSLVREGREHIIYYDVDIAFERAGATERSRHRGDYLAGSHRCDYGDGGEKSLVLQSDHMITSAGPDGNYAFVNIQKRNLNAVSFDQVVDIRIIGLTNLTSNSDAEMLSVVWKNQCDSADMAVLERAEGIAKVAVQVMFHGANTSVPGSRVFTIDENRGHTVRRVDLYVGPTIKTLTSSFLAGTMPMRTSTIDTEWEEKDGCWVPITSRIVNDPDGGRREGGVADEVLRLDWRSVNVPLDSENFSYVAFASPGTEIYDHRVDPPVLVESVPLKPASAVVLENSPLPAYARWVLLGLGALFGAIALMAFLWRRGSGRIRT